MLGAAARLLQSAVKRLPQSVLGCRFGTSPFPEKNLNPLFLRDSCLCSRCIDSSTSQKLFETADIPLEINIKSAQDNADGSTTIEWQNDISGYDNHTSTYSLQFFKDNESPSARKNASFSDKFILRTLWNRDMMASRSAAIDYSGFINDPAALFHALTQFQALGLVFISNVPSEPDSINCIANRIGPIRNTFYGPVWDVRAVPSAKNVAYTSSSLGFHMVSSLSCLVSIVRSSLGFGKSHNKNQDLLYMENPPGLQLLHCLRASEKGGESLFSDAFHACQRMEREFNDQLCTLQKFPVTYWYKNDGVNYQHTKPVVERYGTILERTYKAVNWAPPFQAPFSVGIGNGSSGRFRTYEPYDSSLKSYIKAAKTFKQLIEDSESVYETKMEAGSCAIFNNRRIAHARRGFEDMEGKRWLRGCYVDTDAFASRLRTLYDEHTAQQLGGD